MMHHDGTIVTLRTLPDKKPLREYQHTKHDGGKSRVVVRLPFDSEYAFNFKFQDKDRRRLELHIDGALVVDSLILDPSDNPDCYLERFLNSDKRFKFVSADSEGVADPSEPKNGLIEIKLWREKKYLPPLYIKGWETGILRGTGWVPPASPKVSLTSADVPTRSFSADISLNADTFGPMVFDSNQIHCSSDVGATVEGTRSNQKFSSTIWGGDQQNPLEFSFQLRGEAMEVSGFCRACGVKLAKNSSFCHVCGTQVIEDRFVGLNL